MKIPTANPLRNNSKARLDKKIPMSKQSQRRGFKVNNSFAYKSGGLGPTSGGLGFSAAEIGSMGVGGFN